MPITRTITTLTLFAAAPAELETDKQALADVVAELNRLWRPTKGIEIRFVSWETDAYPNIGLDAQDVINHQVGDDYDIFVGLMWSRFGTPTGRFGSGTEEEFERAHARHTTSPGCVTIMFYFNDEPLPPSKIDPVQFAAVSKFRRGIEEKGVFHRSYSSRDQFSKLLRLNLNQVVDEWDKRNGLSDRIAPTLKPAPQANLTLSNPFQEDEELGFFDLLETGESSMAEAGSANERLAQSLLELGGKIESHTGQLDLLSTSPIQARLRMSKRIADSIAEDMTSFAKRVEVETPIFGQKLRDGIDAFTKAILITVSLNPDELKDAETALTAIEGFLETIVTVQPQVLSLRNTIARMPPMTQTTNKARKRLARAMDEYLTEIQNAEILMREMIHTLRSVLPASHDHPIVVQQLPQK